MNTAERKINNNRHNVFLSYKIYKIVIYSFPILLVIFFLLNQFGIDIYFINAWIIFALMACSFSVIIEFYYLYKMKFKPIVKTFEFKILVSAVVAIVAVISNIQIKHFINDLTGLNPSYFPDARLALQLFFMTISWLNLLIFIMFFITLYQLKNENRKDLFSSIFLSKNNSDRESLNKSGDIAGLGRIIGLLGVIY